ncbi:MAG: 4-hydroxythreonine-4-phosphate dehydrogenase PdxA [Lachnospiraceae bacterium]|nr:4-hydroxythreonine-4-phosphate dehydrogenase PdxA [Lachnospiraceae bacterium]
MDHRKIIGISMGDPAGIGPEITLKALSSGKLYEKCRPVVYGSADVLEIVSQYSWMPPVRIRKIADPSEAVFEPGVVNVVHVTDLVRGERDGAGLQEEDLCFRRGTVSAEAGEAAFRYVMRVIEAALRGDIDATVTNPINKEAVNLAGHHYSGHTEIYADATGTKRYTMMLAHGNLKVVHVSTHVSLREACDRVKKANVLEKIRIADEACRKLGIREPRIAVAGLNPHAGENGMFGREEIEEIGPAVEEARALGIQTEGPVPPDTVFSKAAGGMYDIVVAMYHDQGHIPLKVLGFTYNEKEKKWNTVSGVNITLGLPIIRTSVDHGTAFDQIRNPDVSEQSLINAVEYAVMMADE